PKPYNFARFRSPGLNAKQSEIFRRATNGGVYNLTDRKYWDYLSSRNIETGTNQDANDKALAVMPGRTWQLGVNVDF
ncbi:TPA: hypothetical protein ACN7S0_001313, partial [Klebsiella pneumoniae]